MPPRIIKQNGESTRERKKCDVNGIYWPARSRLQSVQQRRPAQDKVVNLKLSYWVPPSHLLTPGYKDWAEAIEKASNGTITVTLFPSSQLGSGPDHYDMVKRGVADFGLINPGYTPGRFPVIAAADLPFLITDSIKAAAATHAGTRSTPKRRCRTTTCVTSTRMRSPPSTRRRKSRYRPT